MSTGSSAKLLAPYLEPLTEQQRIFVECSLKGMSDIAAATAAGVSVPKKNAYRVKQSKAVQEALKKGIELLATDVMFTRKKAHDMLLDAHSNAQTTTEQVLAINAMIKLHGIAAPEVKEIHQTVHGSIEHHEVKELTDEQLLRIAQLPDNELPAIIEGEYSETSERESGRTEGRKTRKQEKETSS